MGKKWVGVGQSGLVWVKSGSVWDGVGWFGLVWVGLGIFGYIWVGLCRFVGQGG